MWSLPATNTSFGYEPSIGSPPTSARHESACGRPVRRSRHSTSERLIDMADESCVIFRTPW